MRITTKMEHYVTLFDSLFLPQGLALHTSMQRYCGEYTLWILCMDEHAFEVLSKLRLPNVRLLSLAELETSELKAIKSSRSKGEYCWTLTPFSPGFVFAADASVDRVTYIDADLWFRKSPDAIFIEFQQSGKSVMITDHSYLPEYDFSAETGQFCVQFLIFDRTGSQKVRTWWEQSCLEWCFARYEDGKFGDQKYLDDWPQRFAAEVHVLRREELLLAPWNATRFAYGQSVCYHFHGLRLLNKDRLLLAPSYPLPKPLLRYVYQPYIKDFKAALIELRGVGWMAKVQASDPGILRRLLSPMRVIKRNLWRYVTHHVVSF